MISVFLKDGGGKGFSARISPVGELAVAPIAFSDPIARELTAINVPANFFVPKAGHSLVVTDIILYANRNVGVNDATVLIYEATGSTITASQKTLLRQEMAKQTSLPLNGLNWNVTGGAFLNARTNDSEVFVTIAAYFRPIP